MTMDADYSIRESVTLAPVTRGIRGIPLEWHLDPEDGLPGICVVTLDNITVIPKDLLCGPSASRTPPKGRRWTRPSAWLWSALLSGPQRVRQAYVTRGISNGHIRRSESRRFGPDASVTALISWNGFDNCGGPMTAR